MRIPGVLLTLALVLGTGSSAHADRALPSWEAHRGERALATALEAWARGDVRAAETAANIAVSMTPDRGAAWHILALSRLALGRMEAAAETVEPLSRLAPEDVDVWLLRGRIATESGDARGARRAYDEAARRAPTDPRPLLGRALVAARIDQDFPSMAAHLRSARVVDPAQPDATLPLQAAWAPLATDERFLKALQSVLSDP